MYNIGVVKVFQSFSSVRELKGAQSVANQTRDMTYEFQVFASILTDVLHDVSVGHPFGDHGEPSVLEGVRDSDEVEDVGMGQVFQQGNLFTETLYGV